MKVSIITPAFNQAAFLEETIISVLNQDYPDIEYIVINDGSTDDTSKLMERYEKHLHYLHHDNIGESRTVNKGYRLSSGDIVGVVNADDPLYTKDAISRIVECFQTHSNALAVYPDWVSINEHGQLIDTVSQPLFTISNMLLNSNITLGPGMFIKQLALEKVGYRNESLKYTGDLDMSFRLALAGELAHVPQLLATHRVHSNAASATGQGEVMAREVFNLAKSSVNSHLLSTELLHNRPRILANFCINAANFCGSHWILISLYIGKAVYLSPVYSLQRLALSIMRRSLRLIGLS
jgi:glycosyltransferase involved in cell wall biosynthesis